MNESVTTTGGRHVLRMERRLRHPSEKVWRAVAEPKHLSAWWPTTIDAIPLEVGAPLHFYDETGAASLGVITELQQGRVLGFRDQDGEHEVRLEIVPEAGGCSMAGPCHHSATTRSCGGTTMKCWGRRAPTDDVRPRTRKANPDWRRPIGVSFNSVRRASHAADQLPIRPATRTGLGSAGEGRYLATSAAALSAANSGAFTREAPRVASRGSAQQRLATG